MEGKIRYLIRKFPHTEWSGVLFYTHQGSFENGDLVITCQDIYPMDLGSSGWTEFKMSEDVASYMAQNIELFDCETGLVHSHHSIGAFLSGQDMKMVQQEGNDTNCFVSLVVDTKGTYVAIITRKLQSKSEITIKSLGASYEFFGEGSKSVAKSNDTTQKVIDKEFIEYFNLEVERHEVSNSFEYLDSRFEEIQQRKMGGSPILDADNLKVNELSVGLPNIHLNGNMNYDWSPNPKDIHKAVVNIITCNLILNPDKLDLKQWITRHMVNVYRKIFGESCFRDLDPNALESCNAFAEWRDFIIQFTLDYFDYSTVPDSLMESDSDIPYSRVAQAIADEIHQYIGNNKFLESYYNTLLAYIIE